MRSLEVSLQSARSDRNKTLEGLTVFCKRGSVTTENPSELRGF